MGFRTLPPKKEVVARKILNKTEFDKFADQLEKVDKQLHTASNSLNELNNKKIYDPKLKDVGTIDAIDAQEVQTYQAQKEYKSRRRYS